MKRLLYILILIVSVISCSSDSSDILSMGEMEDILYDIHLSQNMLDDENRDKRVYTEIANHEAILRKYGVTQAEWDSSYNYYCCHAEDLYKIYQNLSERIRSEVIDLGGDVALDEMSLSGDTANIWNSERNFILMPQAPYNINQFAIKADSTFKVGDVLTLQYDIKFIFQEGSRNLVTVLAVTLDNDSVVSVTRHDTYDGRNSVTFSDSERHGVKSVNGYFILLRSNNEQVPNAFRLASVENVRLVLAHSKEVPEQPINTKPNDEQDTLKTDSVARNSDDELNARPEDRSPVRLVSKQP